MSCKQIPELVWKGQSPTSFSSVRFSRNFNDLSLPFQVVFTPVARKRCMKGAMDDLQAKYSIAANIHCKCYAATTYTVVLMLLMYRLVGTPVRTWTRVWTIFAGLGLSNICNQVHFQFSLCICSFFCLGCMIFCQPVSYTQPKICVIYLIFTAELTQDLWPVRVRHVLHQ